MTTTPGITRRFRLTANAFHGGRFRNRGEIVELGPNEFPGEHMIPAEPEAAAPVRPLIVQAAVPIERPPAPEPIRLEGAQHVVSGPGFVVLDTETNGFKDPRLASIGLIFASPTFEIQHEVSFLIRPNGWSMSQEATGMNGLTDEALQEKGIDVAAARFFWRAAIALERRPIGHNLGFDLRVMENEFRHAGEDAPAVENGICTLAPARNVASSGELRRAHKEIVGEDFNGAHDALADAQATLRLFKKLVELGEITP